MVEQLEEPAYKTLRRLLYQNWDPTNTADYNPRDESGSTLFPLHYGEYQADMSDPQVTLTQTQGEFTVGGGRWSGKNMSSGEMNQHRRGMVVIQTWASVETEPYNGEPADDMATLLRQEVERVVDLFHLGPDSGKNSTIIKSFSSEWNGLHPEQRGDSTDVMWQSQVTVTYDWFRE